MRLMLTFPFHFIWLMVLVIVITNTLEAVRLVLHHDMHEDNIKLLSEHFAEPVYIEKVTFQPDVWVSTPEFVYLTDIRPGVMLTFEQVKKAISYLWLKKKFSKIVLTIDGDKDNAHLTVDLESFWTLKRVSVKGVLFGKDQYKQLYLMEPGDIFEIEKHRHSLDKLIQSCKAEGYFDARIKSTFKHDRATKSVVVNLILNQAKQFKVSDIDVHVEGDDRVSEDERQRISREVYRLFLKQLVHDGYKKVQLDEQTVKIKQYLAQNGFLHISIDLQKSVDYLHKQVDLNFTINVHHKRLFVFFGNQFFTQQQLFKQILKFGRSSWLLPPSMLAQELRRIYYQKGFWDIQIDTREEDERYYFIIKEGERARIEQIELRNVTYCKPRTLLKKCFGELRSKKNFDQDLLTSSLDALGLYYIQRGFLHAKVMGHEFEPLKVPGTYKLTVTLDEGKRVFLKDVEIHDYNELKRKGPFRRLQKKGDAIPFDPAMVKEQRQWLMQELFRKGIHFPLIKPELEYLSDEHVLLRWHIEQTKRSHVFGKTVLQGCSQYPYEYFNSVMNFSAGQMWDQEKIRESFKRLKERELFEGIQIVPSADATFAPERPVVISVYEDEPFEIRARAGLGFQQVRRYHTFGGLTYKLGGTFIAKNPFERGDVARLDLDFARSHREIVGRYEWPVVAPIPMNLHLQVYSIKHDHPGFIGTKRNMYDVIQHGFLFGSHKKTMHFDSGVNVGFEWMETGFSDSSVISRQLAIQLARAINFEPRFVDQRVPFLFFEPTLFVDYLDNKLNPHQGSLSIITLKGMFPLKGKLTDAFFIRLLVEQSLFVPLRSAVVAIRLRFGHIFHQEFKAIMPSERFYLGGANSLRSFDTDFVPPLGCYTDEKGESHRVPRGGKSMLNLNAEIRVPVHKDIGIVLFQDMGLLSGDNFAEFKADNVRAATGFGLRYLTPIGPLRFDIGWKWRVDDPCERKYAWFLTFGHAF